MSSDRPPNDRRPSSGRPNASRPHTGRPDRGPRRPPIDPEQAAQDVRRFAELMKAKQDKERKDQADARQRAADEKRRVEQAAADVRRAADASTAKDRAAQRLKDIRARGSAAQVAEAEVAYKAALAEQIAVEQGERPAWAPAPAEPELAVEPPAAASADVEPVAAEPEPVVAEPELAAEPEPAVAEPEPDPA